MIPPNAYEPIVPRGLSLIQSAHYVGIGPSLFVALVRMGRMPQAKLIGKQLVWDRHALDAAFEDLPMELAVPSYPAPPTTAVAGEKQLIPIHIPPPTKEQIAAVRLRMDMDRYGQSTEGMTDAQIDKLEQQWYERWKQKVIASPLNKREKAALPRLYEERHRVVMHGEIKGASWTTEDRLEVRGYVTLNKHNDLTVSWQITEAGIKAYNDGVAR
jgi:predicted DNA-binding transcriptional regulator AlpA